MALALAVVTCLLSGYLIIALSWPLSSTSTPYHRLLRSTLSAGFGIGLFSIVFFFVRVLDLRHPLAIDLVVAGLLLVGQFLQSVHSTPISLTPAQESIELPRWLRRVLPAALGISLAAAVYSAILRSIVHPHGDGWDAFAIWNLHARFLFRAGEHWRDGFSPLIPWSHPDYPLLLPSAVAQFWSVLGHESTAVPAVIGLIFTFSTLGILFSSLEILRGPTSAMLGGLALTSTPFFIEQGSSQYADVPLSFFFLAVIALIHLNVESRTDQSPYSSHSLVALAGIAAGFAIWTKNEGMLFLVASVLAQIVVRGRQWTRQLAIFLAAVAPFLVLVLWFKHSIAFPNEIFSNQPGVLHKILEPARYWAILRWFVKDFLRFGEWWLFPGTLLLMLLWFGVADKPKSSKRPELHASILTVTLTLAGYFAIYIITPYDLYWHLRFSLNRLFLQLWPCIIFLVFLAMPRKVVEKSQNGTKFAQN